MRTETGWAPFNKVEVGLGLDVGDGGVGLVGIDISTVQKRNGHVLSVPWVADNHLVVWFEAYALN